MDVRRLLIAVTLVSIAAPAAGQRIEHREVVRVARAYQGRDRGPEQTERFSRKVRVGRDGRVSIGNISGDITVTGGGGDDVSIDAVKRTRGDRAELGRVQIIIDERGGRVDIRTEHERDQFRGRNRGDQVSVDYTITMPSGAALDAKSISGNVKVTNVQGAVRAESISGNVATSKTPRLELAKAISGDVDLTDAGAEAELTASSVSGAVRATGLRARSLDVGTVSGDIALNNVTCDRLGVKSVSGDVEYSGALARNGRYDVNTHSGEVRLMLSGSTGFELNASTFSGSIRSDFPVTIGGNRDRDAGRRRGPNNRSISATFGDGSAALTLRTFSGDIVIGKR
jgi:putative adhesin